MKARFYVHLINGTMWAYAAAALVVLGATWIRGPAELEVFRIPIAGFDVNLGLRFDFLSTLLLTMVTLLGAVVGQFAIRYLDGESRQNYFYHCLLGTVSAVALLMISNNLLMVFLMWIATSWGLHKLLTFYPQRLAAVLAARKKFLISRLGDLALLTGIILTYLTFGTLEFSDLFAMADSIAPSSHESLMLSTIGFFFVLGAMTKSAQFPFHFWLPETMETPTPVSALMHAGIINAGGFLVIRLSPLLQHAEAAHLLLLLMGSVTAVFGALVMITQNDIKKKLAYSTISQMGMMMLACGLGAYSLALFHMIAHSFYKAHAFLTTGLIVEEPGKINVQSPHPSALRLTFASLVGLTVIIAGAIFQDGVYFSYFTYAAILLLGLLQTRVDTTIGTIRNLKIAIHVSTIMIIAGTVFMIFEYAIKNNLSSIVPFMWGGNLWQSGQAVAGFTAFCLFVIGLWASAYLERMPQLYMYLWNGGYFSLTTNRILQRYSAASE